MCHRHGGIPVAGDEGQFVVQKARPTVQRGGQSVFNVNVGLAEARTARHPEHLAAVLVQQPSGDRQAARPMCLIKS